MKHLYILTLMLLGFMHAAAAELLSEDWTGCPAGTLPEGWTTWGTDKTPTGTVAEFFCNGEGFKVMSLSETSSRLYAVSYSSTAEGGTVNTGLVTPEIDIPAGGAILRFTAANRNTEGTSSNKMSVCVSETGGTESDFSTVLLSKRISANSYDSPETMTVSLSEYAGKKIRLAFVNEGNGAGLLGITDISIADYFATIHNYTPLLFRGGENIVFDVDLTIQAQCRGFKATLSTDNGYSQTLATGAYLDGSEILVRLEFPEYPAIAEGEILHYEIEVSPNIEGATPTVMSGTTGCGEGFDAVLVEEEATGEKCGYCPAGAAGIEKFSEEFGKRFIGIGIHCTPTFSTGVMENHEYSDPFLSDPNFMITGLPSAVFNRKRIVSPTDFSGIQREAEDLLSSRSAAEVKIDKVSCDFDSGQCSVEFTTGMALPYNDVEVSAAAVVIADSLKGYGPKWYQTDYFSGRSKEDFLKTGDESWWPYMKFYCEYPSKNISPTDMAFNHVGMGIYPDYNGDGCLLPSDWTVSRSAAASISFTMPMQEETNEFGVQDIAHTSIALLVFNHRSGEIIAADKVSAHDYNRDLSEVTQTFAEDMIDIVSNPYGVVLITASEDCRLLIHSIDGRCISNRHIHSGVNRIQLPPGQMYILKASNSTKTYTRKLIVK